jgi:PAS domain S-box-containing protein
VGSYRDLFEATGEALVIVTEGGALVDANTQARALFGGQLETLCERVRHLPAPTSIDTACEAADGRRFAARLTVRHATLDGVPRLVASVRERSREERFQALSAATTEGVVVHEAGVIVDANEAFARLVEAADPEHLVGRTLVDVLGLDEQSRPPPDHDPSSKAARHFEISFLRADGVRRLLEVRASTTTWLGRSARLGYVVDVTEQRAAAVEARSLERRLAQALAATADSNWEWNYRSQLLYYSATWYELMGYPVRLDPMPFAEWKALVHPDDLSLVLERARTSLAHHPSPRFEVEARMKAADATWRWMLIRGNVVERDEQGERTVVVGTIGDITERKHAEAERARLEDNLRQAQKMESIGRLAGGVAHDFNNMLSTIIGNTTMALAETRPEDPLHELLVDVEAAANSAAQVTRQLLALSRKQVIAPRVLDLNEAVGRVHKMLSRLLGAHITVRTELDPALAPVMLDPNQFEQVVVNLCVNARDAMPHGGTLTLQTRNLAGERGPPTVNFSVIDTGVGMSAEVKAHLFEPFFTTKPFGKGTGLGLSMVYGAVTQNHGHIEVISATGQGTTFSLSFPAATVPVSTASPAPLASNLPRGSEIILVAEDRDDVRALAQRMLARQGYVVHAFPDAASLLAALPTISPAPQLLFTDVVMPGLNGKQLAEQVRLRFPELPVLFTSGYLDDVVGEHGVLEPGFDFVPKPYSLPVIATRIRAALDRRSAPTPGP